MDKVYLLSEFLSQKGFLKKLYKNEEPASRILSVANDRSLNVLLKILFLIATGEITLRSADSATLKKSLRMKKLLQFESKKFLLNLLNNSRQEKLTVLKQFVSVYTVFLYSFFNEN
jgi:hypothetical protein